MCWATCPHTLFSGFAWGLWELQRSAVNDPFPHRVVIINQEGKCFRTSKQTFVRPGQASVVKIPFIIALSCEVG